MRDGCSKMQLLAVVLTLSLTLTTLAVTSVTLYAEGQTCAEAGHYGFGPNCRADNGGHGGPVCVNCLIDMCEAYANGDSECALDCVLGGGWACVVW